MFSHFLRASISWQYFLDPKVAKEPVPLQLEQIAKEILVPLLPLFHQFVEKVVISLSRFPSLFS